MLQGVSKQKICIAVDLDYTLFKTHKDGIEWIGGEDFWQNLFKELEKMCSIAQVDMVFVVVTRKGYYDDLCEAAAQSFQHLLIKYHQKMYVQKENKDYCYVSHNDVFCYYSISEEDFDIDSVSRFYDFTSVLPDFSHFVLTQWLKSSPIKKIAARHGIPIDRCILIDDTPEVLEDAKRNNIDTIDLRCFNDDYSSVHLLDDERYVSQCLEKAKSQLFLKVQSMLEAIKIQEIEKKPTLLPLHKIRQVKIPPQMEVTISDEEFCQSAFGRSASRLR